MHATKDIFTKHSRRRNNQSTFVTLIMVMYVAYITSST